LTLQDAKIGILASHHLIGKNKNLVMLK